MVKRGVPGAIGIGEEVVARLDVRIAGGQVQTEIADRRTIGLRGGCCRQRAGSRGARRGRGSYGHRFLLDGLCGAGQRPQRSHARRQSHRGQSRRKAAASCGNLTLPAARAPGRATRRAPPAARARFGAEVQEADDGIVRCQSERRLHRSVVGRAAGLPHGIEAERQRREHHGVRRRSRGKHLLDERNLHRRVAARGDHHDERRAQRLEALALQRLRARCAVCARRCAASSSPKRSRAAPRMIDEAPRAAAGRDPGRARRWRRSARALPHRAPARSAPGRSGASSRASMACMAALSQTSAPC